MTRVSCTFMLASFPGMTFADEGSNVSPSDPIPPLANGELSTPAEVSAEPNPPTCIEGLCPTQQAPEVVVEAIEEQVEEPVEPELSMPVPDYEVSITTSPVHFALRGVEVTAEFERAERVSWAVFAGGTGTDTMSATYVHKAYGDTSLNDDGYVYIRQRWSAGAGVQGRFMVLGDFSRNLHAGLEVQYRHSGGYASISWDRTARYGYYALSVFETTPSIGGKYVWDSGFTIDGQIGIRIPQPTFYDDDYNDDFHETLPNLSQGDLATLSQRNPSGPNVNIGIGWSF